MSNSGEHAPGQVLKTIVEEHEYLNQFMGILKRRLELDRKYIQELEQLDQCVNAGWSQSTIWPLVGPMLVFFSNEISARHETCKAMSAYISELTKVDPPDKPEEGEGSMSDQYQELDRLCREHDRIHAEASTPAAITELKRWRNEQPSAGYIEDFKSPDIQLCSLLPTDRAYRQSVLRQQKKVAEISSWHNTVLFDRLEGHRQHTEDIKNLIDKLSTGYGDLSTKLATQLTAAKEQLDQFSPPSFVSESHDLQQLEAGHVSMRPVTLIDVVSGEKIPMGIFGTERAATVMQEVMDLMVERKRSFYYGAFPPKEEILELEKRFRVDTTIKDTLKSFSDLELHIIFSFILLSESPLIPIPDDEFARYSRGIPREKLQSVMDRTPPKHRRLIQDVVIMWGYGYRWLLAALLTHRPGNDAWRAIRDIFYKWDFENHSTLPKGVERIWKENEQKAELVWQHNSQPYVPP
ncbi:hypothetical protein CPB86DRAFT_787729 [Serendipita vermifera]|nr:hypothetical protein CPB86DRAFT_787729 [Serendipita vermifera]